MDAHDLVVWTLVVVGGLVVVGLALIAALFYLVLPVDVVPEALLGPLGLVDDAGIVTVVAIWVYKLAKARQRLVEGGVIKQRPR